MNLLSIDVGIKNLALCLFVKDPDADHVRVAKWDVLNIAEHDAPLLCQVAECGKPAKFTKLDTCFCVKHAKKQSYQIPTLEQKTAFVAKQKLAVLHEIADKYGIVYDSKSKKVDLVQRIHAHFQTIYFDAIQPVKAGEVDLYHLGVNMQHKLDAFFGGMVDRLDYVIIENQIGPLAIRMKTLQGMLVQYFVMSPIDVAHVEFISASNKLKDCDAKDKEKYSDRKKLGVSRCSGILTQDYRFSEHQAFFSGHKKKDDLADAFLQGLWYINHHTL
ncbi:MAG: hypothetical protein ACOVRN_16875 [Flavobacterium sp.]